MSITGGDTAIFGQGPSFGEMDSSQVPDRLWGIVRQVADFNDNNVAGRVDVSTSTVERTVERPERQRPQDAAEGPEPEAQTSEQNVFSIEVRGPNFSSDPEGIREQIYQDLMRQVSSEWGFPGLEDWVMEAYRQQIDPRTKDSRAQWMDSQMGEISRIADMPDSDLKNLILRLQTESPDGCRMDASRHPDSPRNNVVNTGLCWGSEILIGPNHDLIRDPSTRAWLDRNGNQVGHIIQIDVDGQAQEFYAPFVRGEYAERYGARSAILNPIFFNVLKGDAAAWNRTVSQAIGNI